MARRPLQSRDVPSRFALVLLATALGACGRFGFGSPTETADGTGSSTDRDAAIDARVRAPLTFVQAHADVSDATPTTTFATAFPGPTKIGDLLVAGFAYDSALEATVFGAASDSQGNTWLLAGQQLNEDGFGQYVMYTVASAATADTVTVTLSDVDASYIELHVLEYSGQSTTSPLDFEATQTMTITDGIAGPASTAPLVTADVDEQIVAYIVGHPGSVQVGSGFTERTLVAGDLVEDELAATPGSYPVNLIEDSFGTWTAESAVFH